MAAVFWGACVPCDGPCLCLTRVTHDPYMCACVCACRMCVNVSHVQMPGSPHENFRCVAWLCWIAHAAACMRHGAVSKCYGSSHAVHAAARSRFRKAYATPHPSRVRHSCLAVCGLLWRPTFMLWGYNACLMLLSIIPHASPCPLSPLLGYLGRGCAAVSITAVTQHVPGAARTPG